MNKNTLNSVEAYIPWKSVLAADPLVAMLNEEITN